MSKDIQGVAADAAGLSPSVEPVPVSPPDGASIPNAEWPCWAAVTTHDEYRSGSLCTVLGFRWLFAPTETDAEFGARKWFRECNPRARNLEVFVREVPAQAIEARRAETAQQAPSSDESAVHEVDAPDE